MNTHPGRETRAQGVTRSASALGAQGAAMPAPGGMAPPRAGAEPGSRQEGSPFGAVGEIVVRWQATARSAVTAHPRLSYAVLLIALFGLALWSRYRYVLGDYTYTFGSGDGHLILTKALFIREGIFHPSPELVPVSEVFDQPPLIPLLLASVSLAASIPLELATFIVVPLLTSVALLVFFDLIRRTFDVGTAVLAAGLLALLPSYSFHSTEPEKAPFVVSFAVIALWLLVLSEKRRALLPLAGLFLGLAAFSHTTGYLFIPVFALSYVFLRGLSRRTVFDPLFLFSLIVPAFFVAAYFLLAKYGESSATTTAAEVTESGFLPAFVQTYVDSLRNLVGGGITDRAWNSYFDAIRGQLSTPIYVAAIAGFALALAVMIRTGRRQMAPVALWMFLLTVGFAVQWPASSHGSRYPHYVTPAFLALAAFFVVTAFRWLSSRSSAHALVLPAAVAGLLAIVGFSTYTYATSPTPGFRQIYGGHRDLAEYIASEGLLDDGSHLLYLGWPSVTLYLLEDDIEYRDQIHSFGWGLRDLEEFTPEFIRAYNIRYYAENHIANDGFDSSEIVMAALFDSFRTRQLGRFERSTGNYVTLYRLEDVKPPYEEALQDHLRRIDTETGAQNLATNPTLRWQKRSILPGWTPNGHVDLEPPASADTSGVVIRNNIQFGGIRQVINAGPWAGRTVTAVTTIRAAEPRPAHSVVISLAPEGEPPFSQIFVPLRSGDNVVALEAELPEHIGMLRLTVATGKGDDGDLFIQRAYLLPESVAEILERFEQRTSAGEAPLQQRG